MKNKKKVVPIILFIVLVLAIFTIYNTNNKKEIEIIQLSPQSKSQMMGYIIKTKNNQIIAIDGGISADTQNFVKYINENNWKVNYWFLTHAHNDHASVLVDVINNKNVEIENIYASLNEKEWYYRNEPQRADFSNDLIDTLSRMEIKSKVKEPKLNETINIDGIKTENLGVRNPEITENPGNEQSMVIKFDTGNTSLLILGDIGENSSKKLLETQRNKLKSDIVQMAHHGQAGATQELYKAINPQICMWPTPDWLWNNDAGDGFNTGPWKTIETRNWMKQLNVKENYIAKDGDIIIKIK